MSNTGNNGEHDAAERVRVQVTGRVQGVFFRDATQQRADEVGVSGWVRNLPDGRVEAVFEGDPDQVRELIAWCESGPSSAEVEDVSAEPETPEGLTGFEVR